MKKIAYFVTGHGYGHGVRSSIIMNALPQDSEIYIFTTLAEAFFQGELPRPFHYFPCEIDCGCIQPDTIQVDKQATLEKYAALANQRSQLLTNNVTLLKKLHIDWVIGDIPPLAFAIAHQAKLPSIAIGNFTWTDIYQPYIADYPQFAYLLEIMRSDYAQATHSFWCWPHLKNNDFSRIEEVGLLFRHGQACRQALAQQFHLDPAKKWCLVYIGNYGLEGIAWEKLNNLSDYEFFGLYPLPNAPANYHLITKTSSYRYADLSASADVVLGKLGYNLVAECLGLGKPILFLSREDFCEYEILKHPLIERQQGIEIHLEQLQSLELKAELDLLTARSYFPISENAVNKISKRMREIILS